MTSFEFLWPANLALSISAQLNPVRQATNRLLFFVQANQVFSACPLCQQVSTKTHGYCSRTLQDLSWADNPVSFSVRIKRFLCTNSSCSKRTFSQNLEPHIAAYARKTIRCSQTLQRIALALGGEAGKRLAQQLNLTVSGATLLRLIKALPLPPVPTPRVLGVDDFAFAKGQRYGTLLVDLECHKIIDVLADRQMQTFATWLSEHPGIEIVSRDRGSAYSEAARKAAPSAIQVADRFHLYPKFENDYRTLYSP